MKMLLSALLLVLFTLPVWAEKTILIVGNSISAGYGMTQEQSWPALLQHKLKNEHYDYLVVNASISGDTTTGGLARLPKALSENKPSITVIELGGNDGLRGQQLLIIKSNLKKMIELSKSAGSKVLLLGLRMPSMFVGSDYGQQFQQIYTDLAKQTDISFVPLFLKDVDDNAQMMQEDHIHPKAAAQQTILDNIWVVLQRMI